jgi:hypothetical protein
MTTEPDDLSVSLYERSQRQHVYSGSPILRRSKATLRLGQQRTMRMMVKFLKIVYTGMERNCCDDVRPIDVSLPESRRVSKVQLHRSRVISNQCR